VFEVVRHNRLRWFGYVGRKCDDGWVKKCQQVVVVDSKAGRGSGKKTWLECVRGDMKKFLLRVDAKDRQV